MDYSNYRPDGTTTHGEDVYVRISGGPGFSGKWKDESAKFTPDTMVITTPSAATFEIA